MLLLAWKPFLLVFIQCSLCVYALSSVPCVRLMWWVCTCMCVSALQCVLYWPTHVHVHVPVHVCLMVHVHVYMPYCITVLICMWHDVWKSSMCTSECIYKQTWRWHICEPIIVLHIYVKECVCVCVCVCILACILAFQLWCWVHYGPSSLDHWVKFWPVSVVVLPQQYWIQIQVHQSSICIFNLLPYVLKENRS